MTDAKEPGLEHLIAQASREGWAFFDNMAAFGKGAGERSEADPRTQRVALIAAVLAQTPEFNELLDYLLDKSLRRATFIAQFGLDPMQAYAFGVFREGQNALAFLILKLIAEGRRNEAPKGRDP